MRAKLTEARADVAGWLLYVVAVILGVLAARVRAERPESWLGFALGAAGLVTFAVGSVFVVAGGLLRSAEEAVMEEEGAGPPPDRRRRVRAGARVAPGFVGSDADHATRSQGSPVVRHDDWRGLP